ncbi:MULTISPECIES: NACHT domain-containing NTPase [unclassified Mesorhizobium]|uniref:NACHT domain-containing protein n=1 Tax=unclassified Mesorhizobium TaxID=325217 RepID=UPI001FEF1DAB|nr:MULTISPECIES: hypothetical protein [unclassified Mesorhizobium]
MDEVARIDSVATDQIIAQASDTSTATVIFASRSGEWDRGRTAYVKHCFGIEPVVVRLEPFTEAEQRQLFSNFFPDETFDAFVEEVHKFGLAPLLGNPQFLQLLGAAYLESGRVFTSRAKIFADAVKRLAHEANSELPRQKAKPPTAEIVEYGGEVLAKLLLSGATGIATVEQLSDDDFPFINSLSSNAPLSAFLVDTGLLKPSDDPNKHEPIHRIVAEYCAAGYLVRRIEDPADRLSLGRVMAIIAPNGVTRDELRGMLGWMAALGREPLQLAAIQLDPYAVLANGDPSQLTAKAKQMLLTGLDRLADADPMFRRSDFWRRFNVGHFFSIDILDQLRVILGKAGTLRNLVLELLIGTDAATALVPEITAILRSSTVDADTRKLSQEALLSIRDYKLADDFTLLLAEGSADALEMAARGVVKLGVAAVGAQEVGALLDKLSSLYPNSDDRRHHVSHYFIERLIRSFDLADVIAFLDHLSPKVVCTCSPTHDYRCTCRHGKSKIIGHLLDRYFELSTYPHEPARVWSWVKALHFRNRASEERSASVKHLGANHDLRRSIQQLAMQGARGKDAAHEAVTKLFLSHSHSGLVLHAGDREALSQFAVEQGLVDVWAELLIAHDIWSEAKGPNPARAAQRSQSKTGPEFLAAWALREKSRRQYAERSFKIHRSRGKRYAAREAAVEENNRAHLRENLAQIEGGQHWWWLKRFAQAYLFATDELNHLIDDPETPKRALRNCFPLLDPHVPTVQALGLRTRVDIAQVLLAACIVRFRDGDRLGGIDARILAAAKTEASSYPAFEDGEEAAFEAALDDALFGEPNSAETFARDYLEQQLTATEEVPVSTSWLNHKSAFQHLRATLPLEWLERFPNMPIEAVRSLFGMAAKFGDREQFLALIDRRLADPAIDSGENTEADNRARSRSRFWKLNAFLYHTPGGTAAWQDLRTDPKTIFALEHRLGRFYSDEYDDYPPVTAEMIFQILDAYVEVWPKVNLPNTWGSSDPEEETAYRFLRECIWKIAEDTPDRRIPVLDVMMADPRFADFRDTLLTLRVEASRKLALQDFRAPLPTEVSKMLDENEVASVEDLRALMVEELGNLQKWLDGSDTDPIEQFFSGGKRVDENTARNRIVDRLQGRMTALGLSIVIERHMSGGNRCDITASSTVPSAHRLLVTEVKGQWNTELYTAASAQLDQRYAIHPDAAKQGIYLALWYGNGEKVAGRVDPTITTAEELKEKIISFMPEELRSRVDVVVLDLSRRPQTPKPSKTSKPARRASPVKGKRKPKPT